MKQTKQKALAWTHLGLENISAEEILSIIGAKTKSSSAESSCLLFEADIKDICRLCYNARTLRGLMLYLGKSKFEDLKSAISNLDIPFITEKKSFAARIKNLNFESSFMIDTQSTEAMVGDIVNEKTKASVNLDSPDVTFLVILDKEECYFGIDLAGIDLGKRDYKIFSTRAALKGSVASALLYAAGFSGSGVVLDPFARDGTIAIEAAMILTDKSPHFYQKERLSFTRLDLDFSIPGAFEEWDKGNPISEGDDSSSQGIYAYDSIFHNVNAIKKNSKIAGIDKLINVSRVDIDWIDTKFDKETIDIISSYPLQLSKRSDNKETTKSYKELFHQAEFVLKKKGRIAIIVHDADSFNKIIKSFSKSLTIVQKECIEVFQGKEQLFIIVFEKS